MRQNLSSRIKSKKLKEYQIGFDELTVIIRNTTRLLRQRCLNADMHKICLVTDVLLVPKY